MRKINRNNIHYTGLYVNLSRILKHVDIIIQIQPFTASNEGACDYVSARKKTSPGRAEREARLRETRGKPVMYVYSSRERTVLPGLSS